MRGRENRRGGCRTRDGKIELRQGSESPEERDAGRVRQVRKRRA